MECDIDDLKQELVAHARTLGERNVIAKAHAHFRELLRDGNPARLAQFVEGADVEEQVMQAYEMASMGRATAVADREAANAEGN